MDDSETTSLEQVRAFLKIMLRLGHQVWVKDARVPDGKQPDQMTAEEIQELWGN